MELSNELLRLVRENPEEAKRVLRRALERHAGVHARVKEEFGLHHGNRNKYQKVLRELGMVGEGERVKLRMRARFKLL